MAYKWGMRITHYSNPINLLVIAYCALIQAVVLTISSKGFKGLLDLKSLRKLQFATFWRTISPYIAEGEAEGPIPSLVGSAYGRILELGPGSGSQITRFDKSKVEKIYGVEPVEALHNALRARVKEASLESAYEIVPCGIQDYDVLAKNGITEGSLDCIVSVQVLCSVPNPEESVKVLWKLLKPGGKLIVFEHGRNNDAVTRIIQYMYDPVWSFLIGDCHLTRPIRNTLVNAGEWKGIELREDPEEDAETCCLPRVCGTLTKEGSA